MKNGDLVGFDQQQGDFSEDFMGIYGDTWWYNIQPGSAQRRMGMWKGRPQVMIVFVIRSLVNVYTTMEYHHC